MLPINPNRLPAMYKDALRLAGERQFLKAKQAFETILSIKPDFAEAHFQLARVQMELGEVQDGMAHFDRAAELKPQEPAVWKEYAKVLHDLSDPDRSTAFLEKAKRARIDPALLLSLQNALKPKAGKSEVSIGSAPPAEVQRAIAHLRSGRYRDAADVAQRLLKRHPKVAILFDILANAQAALGLAESAEKSFRTAIRLNPDYPETRSNFGQFLISRGRNEDAIAELRAALKLLPDMPAALAHLGAALNNRFRFKQAIPILKRALSIDPKSSYVRTELAKSLLGEGQAKEVEDILRPILGQPDPGAVIHTLMAQALAAMRRNAEAEEAFDAAIALAPDATLPLSAKATFLQLLGRFDAAEVLFRKVFELEPLNGLNYNTFLVSHKLKPGDPLIAKMQQHYADPNVTEYHRIFFGFSLAKAMEDTKQYDRVFTYLRPANDAMAREYPLDASRRAEQTRNALNGFGQVDFGARRLKSATDFAPIFVTGLPRSGTTLVEQIVASHSTVTGGGELGYAFDAIVDAVGGFTDPDPRRYDLGDTDLVALGHKIEAMMRGAFPGADRITDKGVMSYYVIGPLKLVLPNARIVVVQRDPRDSLLSMYKNVFPPGKHLNTYSLPSLAAYYRWFKDLVDFWREKTPDAFVEIRYEDLIANPEAESRRLIAACGLDWEDQCLSFHENKRRVDTLSVHQVRQPIYASSKQAWRRYEAELGELFEALGPDYMPETA
ncbi:MAG: sulfotransferase [Rhodobacter sp.]|nr:sulfotransferase [Rhodobacter sp.]